MRKTMIFVLLMAALGCVLPVLAQQPPPYVNVRDFGATPDVNGDNDAPAIASAITAACSGGGPRNVYFPPGQYVISSTITLGTTHKNLRLFGAGIWSCDNVPSSYISWNGSASGNMVNGDQVIGLRVSDLSFNGDYLYDAVNKAGKIFRMNSTSGWVAAQWYFERVMLRYADEGIALCDTANDYCNSDCSFVDVGFDNLTTGFHTNGNQALDFDFIRPQFGNCTTGIWLEKGGALQASMLCAGRVGTVIKIGVGGPNVGPTVINGMRYEDWRVGGLRGIVLDASGTNSVIINGLNTTVCDADYDDVTPLFKLATSAQVTVKNSMIFGRKVATLTGDTTVMPTWLRFEQCMFGSGPDPRLTITKDAYSGYDLVRCTSGNGMIADVLGTPTQTTPGPPTNLATSNIQRNSITLTWTDSPDETKYFVYRSTDEVTWTWTSQPAQNATSYQVTGLTANTKYYFKVVALKGNTAQAESLYVNATTLP